VEGEGYLGLWVGKEQETTDSYIKTNLIICTSD